MDVTTLESEVQNAILASFDKPLNDIDEIHLLKLSLHVMEMMTIYGNIACFDFLLWLKAKT